MEKQPVIRESEFSPKIIPSEKDSQNGENHERFEELPEKVYYVDCPEDETTLVALDVKIDHKLDQIIWFDTIRERIMPSRNMKYNEGALYVEESTRGDQQPRHLTFIPMSLDIYNTKVKSHLYAGRDFNDKQEMIDAFMETMHDEYE